MNLLVLSRSVVGAIDAAGLTPSLFGRVRSDPIGRAYKLAQELWRETKRVQRLREGLVILPYSLRACLKNLATAAELAASEGDQNEAEGQDAPESLDRSESTLPPQPETVMSSESRAPAESPDADTPTDLLAADIATRDFQVSRATLQRAVKDGELRSYRPLGAKKNAAHRYSESALAARYPRR